MDQTQGPSGSCLSFSFVDGVHPLFLLLQLWYIPPPTHPPPLLYSPKLEWISSGSLSRSWTVWNYSCFKPPTSLLSSFSPLRLALLFVCKSLRGGLAPCYRWRVYWFDSGSKATNLSIIFYYSNNSQCLYCALPSCWAAVELSSSSKLQFPWHHFEIQNSIPIDWDDDKKNWKLLHNYKSRLQRLSSLRVFCYYGLKKWDNDNILMTTGAVIRERKQEKLFRIVDWVTGAHTLTPLVALS